MFKPNAELKQRMLATARKNLAENKELKTHMGLGDKLRSILPVISAVTTSKEVSIDDQKKRLEICSNCEKLSLIDGKISCGICLCRLDVDDRTILSLIALEEREGKKGWGCKYYGDGSIDSRSKWRQAGV